MSLLLWRKERSHDGTASTVGFGHQCWDRLLHDGQTLCACGQEAEHEAGGSFHVFLPASTGMPEATTSPVIIGSKEKIQCLDTIPCDHDLILDIVLLQRSHGECFVVRIVFNQ